MTLHPILSLSTSLTIAAAVTCGSSSISTAIAAENGIETTAATFQDTSNESYANLRKQYDRLNSYLSSKGRIDSEAQAEIAGLRNQVQEYSAANANDPRPLPMLIQLSTWLQDSVSVDETFGKLSELSNNSRIWTAWANSRIAENRYGDAHMLLAEGVDEESRSAEQALIMARCMIAQNRFDDAIDILTAVSDDAPDAEKMKSQLTSTKAKANRLQVSWEDERALREQEELEGSLPIMQILTSKGPITVILLENQAPNTVANFVNLSEKGFFNGQKFHRVVPNFVAQTGDPNSKPGESGPVGSGGPGYTIPDESSRPDKRLHFSGMLAMAKPGDPTNSGSTLPNSAGSQWYITLEPQESLNTEYTVFGRVLDGQNIAEQLRKNDEVLAITTVSRREKAYLPNTIPSQTEESASTPDEDVESTSTEGG